MSSRKLKRDIEQNHVAIPDKLYFTIGEVARICSLKTHVMPYWEQEFHQLNPVKRGANRRYYTRKDVLLVQRIQRLIYGQGYTTEGARLKLGGSVTKQVKKISQSPEETAKHLIEKLGEISSILDKVD